MSSPLGCSGVGDSQKSQRKGRSCWFTSIFSEWESPLRTTGVSDRTGRHLGLWSHQRSRNETWNVSATEAEEFHGRVTQCRWSAVMWLRRSNGGAMLEDDAVRAWQRLRKWQKKRFSGRTSEEVLRSSSARAPRSGPGLGKPLQDFLLC